MNILFKAAMGVHSSLLRGMPYIIKPDEAGCRGIAWAALGIHLHLPIFRSGGRSPAVFRRRVFSRQLSRL
jgi:hypothetical protein